MRWRNFGYTVDKPSEVDFNVGYTSLASGDATFTAVNWTPLHETTCTKLPVAIRIFIVKGICSRRSTGLPDGSKTADQYKITDIAQLKNPKIAGTVQYQQATES
ncbi:glycine betaine ABC transporter substrate-binding protein [Shigella flexneri]